MKLPDSLGRILLIVSRDEPWLYWILKDQFADEAKVDVLVDRRFRDRREQDLPPTVERRRRDRRQSDVTSALRTRGWAVVRYPGETLPSVTTTPAEPAPAEG